MLRRLYTAAPTLFILVVSLVAGTGCVSDNKEPQTVAEQGVELGRAFETSTPYSTRRLDSLQLYTFFAEHPHYAADSAAVVDFYSRRDMQFAWIVMNSLSASAESFIELSGLSDSNATHVSGISRELRDALDETGVDGAGAPLCDSCATTMEIQLSAEFFRFANRNYGGLLSRDLRELNWFIPRAKKDVSRLLDSMAVGKTDLSAYEPVHPQYQLLKSQFAAYRDLVDVPWPELALPAATRTLEHGDSSALVAALRGRLTQLGDVAANNNSEGFDSTLVAGVQRFQRRHGLLEDGVVGANFLKQLNVAPRERIRTMLINMERLRWVPEVQPPNMLLVNIPEFRLHVYEAGSVIMSMDVVVGTSATRTVVFNDTLSQIVFSPTWTVPRSITRNEILPAIAADPAYLEKNNMEIIGGTDELPVVRQKPGPTNALGRVKFLFPNRYSIYMHDTPSQGTFARDVRAVSHGCIRLSEPVELAQYLLRDDADWPAEKMEAAMKSGVETTVELTNKRPVFIVYVTSFVNSQGELNFRDDIYGHDKRLALELFGDGA